MSSLIFLLHNPGAEEVVVKAVPVEYAGQIRTYKINEVYDALIALKTDAIRDAVG